MGLESRVVAGRVSTVVGLGSTSMESTSIKVWTTISALVGSQGNWVNIKVMRPNRKDKDPQCYQQNYQMRYPQTVEGAIF